MEFNEKLQQLRKQQELTQEQLAEKENQSNLKKVYGLVYGVIDILAICFFACVRELYVDSFSKRRYQMRLTYS